MLGMSRLRVHCHSQFVALVVSARFRLLCLLNSVAVIKLSDGLPKEVNHTQKAFYRIDGKCIRTQNNDDGTY